MHRTPTRRVVRRGAITIACLLLPLAGTDPSHAAAPPIAGLTTRTYANPADPVAIADDDSLVSLLSVGGQPGVIMDVDVAVDIEHTSPNHLDIFLVSPSGTAVTLTTDSGGGNDDVFAGTTFDDQAAGEPSAPNVRNFVYTNGVATGPLQPEGALAALVGEPAQGPWVLVVTDDTNGEQGILNGWSLTISTLPVVQVSDPATVAGSGSAIPNGFPDGIELPVLVSSLGVLLYDVTVTLDVRHGTAADLDLLLTSPAGTTIDLATDIGDVRDDLFAGTTFDDRAGSPISDLRLPDDGSAVALAVPEGALGAFIGENPNGIWYLTVADDGFGDAGALAGWSLTLRTADATCGNGTVDAGETCDDANGADGDGCDSNCTVTGCGNGITTAGEDCDDGNALDSDGCPSTCAFTELDCTDCLDNDADGFLDAMDPDCAPAAFELQSGRIKLKRSPAASPRDSLTLRAGLPAAAGAAGRVGLVVADDGGAVLCGVLGDLQTNGGGTAGSAKGAIGGTGSASVKLSSRRGGLLTVKVKRVDLSTLDGNPVSVGLTVGSQVFGASGPFRPSGGDRRVFP
jgi:cysteine-rich repeat protein